MTVEFLEASAPKISHCIFFLHEASLERELNTVSILPVVSNIKITFKCQMHGISPNLDNLFVVGLRLTCNFDEKTDTRSSLAWF